MYNHTTKEVQMDEHKKSGEATVRSIHLVAHSKLPTRHTLDELNVPRSTFNRWYQLYQAEGQDGLIDRRPNPRQFWNQFPVLSLFDRLVALILFVYLWFWPDLHQYG
jgi:hypothetical protein